MAHGSNHSQLLAFEGLFLEAAKATFAASQESGSGSSGATSMGCPSTPPPGHVMQDRPLLALLVTF